MHRFYHRASSLVLLAVTILGVMSAAASFSDIFNSPTPSSTVEVLNINSFQKLYTGNDEISMRLNITADLQSLFTWNTKQVFVFVAAEYETPKNTLNQTKKLSLRVQAMVGNIKWPLYSKLRFAEKSSGQDASVINTRTIHCLAEVYSENPEEHLPWLVKCSGNNELSRN